MHIKTVSIVVSLATTASAIPIPAKKNSSNNHPVQVEVDDWRGFCACIILSSLNQTVYAVPARQLLENISNALDSSDQDRCDHWTESPGYDITIFADRFGNPTSNISESAGVFAPSIFAFCNHLEFGQKLNLPDFSASTAGLLLPWIALFAQLPRQTGHIYSDLLSILLSIGSPAWISSNIALAVLFCRAVRKRFDHLLSKLAAPPSGPIFRYLSERCVAAKIIIQAFVQASIRLNQKRGSLSSLITFPENHWWWIDAARATRALWRRIDAIFVVQNVIAVLAWVFAIIADFWSLPSQASSNSAEWQICMGTLWLWLFAATFGPIAIKTLYKANAMRDTLSSREETHHRLHFALDNGEISSQLGQTSIVQRQGLTPEHLSDRRQSALEARNENEAAFNNVRLPIIWWFSIQETGEGLNTFLHRYFSSEWSSHHIIGGFETLYDRLKHNEVPKKDDQEETPVFQNIGLFNDAQNSDAEPLTHAIGTALATSAHVPPIETIDTTDTKSNPLPGQDNGIALVTAKSERFIREPQERSLRGSSRQMDRYLRFDETCFTAYPGWKDINCGQWTRFIVANVFGIVVQWGTSGPAIYVMYDSPPIGLGCDSGGLLIYAVGGTFAWLLLTLGSLFSHAALLRYQRWHHENPHLSISNDFHRNPYHSFLCVAAVTSRIVGKIIAFVNAIWILVWSFLTYTNVMETPYCTTAYYSLRNNGWMRLWDFEPAQFTATKVEELQCLVIGSFIAYFACVLIYALTSGEKTRRHRLIITTFLSVGFFVFVLPLYFYGAASIDIVS